MLSRSWARCAIVWLALATALIARAASADPLAPARGLLERALAIRYGTECVQRVAIEISGPAGRLGTRRVELASKLYEGQMYVLGRFTEPTRLRGTAFLAIERTDGDSDYFVYLPAFRKVRRVSAYQRSDPWFETDLSFEDVERHYVGDYELLAAEEIEHAGEPAHRIEVRPRYPSSYARVVFTVAERDLAILRIEYLRRRDELEVAKVIDVPRERLIHRGDAILPGVVHARNLEAHSETRLEVEEVVFDPALRRHFFNAATLEVRGKLPFAAVD